MDIKFLIPQKIKNFYHLGQAVLANFIYGFPASRRQAVSASRGGPARKIKIIGVTGTNGKTTTVWMIGKILEEAGHKVALNSTINFKIGTKEWVNKTKFTTLSSFAVQKFIRNAVKEKCDYLVLETSSHSLDQFRVWGIPFAVAVITNITREHLDYHQTMEEYRKAKLKLFEKAPTIVVNLDMEKPEEYLSCNSKLKFGFTTSNPNFPASTRRDCSSTRGGQIPISNKIPNSDDQIKIIIAENIETGIDYSNYQLQTTNYKLNLPGKFNIENALAATCVGLSQGISLETIKKALEKIKGIPGRMEYVPNNKGFKIIIDYAVTPDSLEKLYELINQIKNILPLEKGVLPTGGEGFEKQSENFKSSPNPSFSKGGEHKIIAVLGACGERDRGKRPIMGKIVAQYADYVIVTNEDPYGEDPNQIINEVFSGVISKINDNQEIKNKQIPNSLATPDLAKPDKFPIPNKIQNSFIEGENCWRILDRRKALKKALKLARPGDFVVITGKGAEETMAIGKDRISWKEKEVVKEELNKI